MTDYLERSILFNTVYVIQMLHPGDETTGQELYDTVLDTGALGWGKPPRYWDLRTEDQLLPTLSQIAEDCRAKGVRPILHIETHGNENGLGLTEPNIVNWRTLTDSLISINTYTELNLLVTMAACYGAHFVKVTDPNRAAPFWGIIGPGQKVTPSDIRRGFQSFYRTLTATMQLHTAIESLKAEVANPLIWTMNPAELVLALGFGNYVDNYTGATGNASALKTLLRTLKKREGWQKPPKGLRAKAEAALANHELFFERFKERFLMIDRFPSNASRFPMTTTEAKAVYDAHLKAAHR